MPNQKKIAEESKKPLNEKIEESELTQEQLENIAGGTMFLPPPAGAVTIMEDLTKKP